MDIRKIISLDNDDNIDDLTEGGNLLVLPLSSVKNSLSSVTRQPVLVEDTKYYYRSETTDTVYSIYQKDIDFIPVLRSHIYGGSKLSTTYNTTISGNSKQDPYIFPSVIDDNILSMIDKYVNIWSGKYRKSMLNISSKICKTAEVLLYDNDYLLIRDTIEKYSPSSKFDTIKILIDIIDTIYTHINIPGLLDKLYLYTAIIIKNINQEEINSLSTE